MEYNAKPLIFVKVPFSEKQREYFRSKGHSERWINFHEMLVTNMLKKQEVEK